MSDLIDRQAAIDALKEHRALYCDNTPDTFSRLSYAEKSRVDELDTAIATLVNLPSAQPEHKKGKWVEDDDATVKGHCSVCGWQSHYYEDDVVGMQFCPNCGADMREVNQ